MERGVCKNKGWFEYLCLRCSKLRSCQSILSISRCEKGERIFLLELDLVDASVLALEDTILNKQIPVLETQGNMGLVVLSGKQGRVTTLLHKQLEHIRAVGQDILVVLDNQLNRLLEDITGLGDGLDTSETFNIEMGTLETVVLGGQGVELLHGHADLGEDVIVLWREDDGDVGLATGDEGAVSEGSGGVDLLEDGLDILEVDVQSDPVREQTGALLT